MVKRAEQCQIMAGNNFQQGLLFTAWTSARAPGLADEWMTSDHLNMKKIRKFEALNPEGSRLAQPLCATVELSLDRQACTTII